MALESAWLAEMVLGLKGHNLMCHGVAKEIDYLDTSPVPHKFRMGLPWQQGIIDSSAWMSSSHWPLADNSLDNIVLQHSLDFTSRPHQLIREASRVLAPNGTLVIIGFNPLSWWGVGRGILPFATDMPSKANLVSINRLKDWLLLLDYSILDCMSGGYCWPFSLGPFSLGPLNFWPFNFKPFNSESINNPSNSFLEKVERAMTSKTMLCGSLYMIVAQKKISGYINSREEAWVTNNPQFGWANSLGAGNQKVSSIIKDSKISK